MKKRIKTEIKMIKIIKKSKGRKKNQIKPKKAAIIRYKEHKLRIMPQNSYIMDILSMLTSIKL